MADPILAILLVTSSASGPKITFCWPPEPKSRTRLNRARPAERDIELDHPGKAIHVDEIGWTTNAIKDAFANTSDGFEWTGNETKGWHHNVSGHHEPHDVYHPQHGDLDSPLEQKNRRDGFEYDDVPVFGYSSNVLASILCPTNNLCHQRFELRVDDLVFIGHPVCSDKDGIWRLKPEKYKSGSRGRGPPVPTIALGKLDENNNPIEADEIPTNITQLESFHLCVAMDMPDPSSAVSSNVSKYLGIVYEQISFAVTAVLYQEQIIQNFVDSESERLNGIREESFRHGQEISTPISCLVLG